jgi:hypothetical protein
MLSAVISTTKTHKLQVLVAYGYGSNIPTTARRRLKQSVTLARQLLAAKRTAQQAEQKQQKLQQAVEKMRRELSDAQELLDGTAQPYHYMIESMRKVRQGGSDRATGVVGWCVFGEKYTTRILPRCTCLCSGM